MRTLCTAIVAAVTLGCSEPPVTSVAASEANLKVGRDAAPPTVLNTQLRSAFEIPESNSGSLGHAHMAVHADGRIESTVMINNIDEEVVRFCHIHWINPAATPEGTGPIIWFLTPTGENLQNAARIQRYAQEADYVNNAIFGPDTPENAATALQALLDDPSQFYVNCHSNTYPPGFVRGNLP